MGGLPEVHRTSVVNAPMQDQADELRSYPDAAGTCTESSLAISCEGDRPVSVHLLYARGRRSP